MTDVLVDKQQAAVRKLIDFCDEKYTGSVTIHFKNGVPQAWDVIERGKFDRERD